MLLGVDRVLTDDRLAGGLRTAAIGLLTNDVAVTGGLRQARIAMLAAGLRVVALFAPEHGISAQGRDGQRQDDGVDRLTGLPVHSLYGQVLRPTGEQLRGIDVMVADLPDVGCRFYTYLWTLSHVMEACADAGVPLVVLDRPNPLGGRLDDVEGPVPDESLASFLGRWPIPVRHCLTLGELARHWRAERALDLDLRVVPVTGWDRRTTAMSWRPPWVPPSPAMPSAMTAMLYPGLGLLEGVNLSEGRGTALPFRAVGAPWVDGAALAARIDSAKLPGVAALPYTVTPTDGSYAGLACDGVLLTVTDPAAVRPVRSGIELIRAVGELWPEHLAERRYRTNVNPEGTGHLDLLLGVPDALAAVRAGDLSGPQATACPDWARTVADALLY